MLNYQDGEIDVKLGFHSLKVFKFFPLRRFATLNIWLCSFCYFDKNILYRAKFLII